MAKNIPSNENQRPATKTALPSNALNEDSLRELQENMKCNNIHIIGILEGGKKEQGIENLLEKVMTENFPNLVREKVMQVQEAQRVLWVLDEPKEAYSNTHHN